VAAPGDLLVAAEELLAAAVDSLDTIPGFDPSLDGAPERRFVAFGPPVLDCCDQLSVWVPQILDTPLNPGGLSAGRKVAAKLTHVYLTITISRCYPPSDAKGTPPSIAALEAAANQLYADGWALWNHLYCLWTSELLFTFCDEVFWDTLRPLGPQGGCAGWDLGIHMTLDGYCDVPSS
jgi:hypothetical protein